MTGAEIYADEDGKIDDKAFYQLNLFLSGQRHYVATVWSESPMPIDASEEDFEEWKQGSAGLIREARKATAWKYSKGHGVIQVINRFPNTPVPMAIDPRGYLPIVDRQNRDLPLGHITFLLYTHYPRIEQLDTPFDIAFYIYIDEEGAAMSDGELVPTNEYRKYTYAGSQGAGFIGAELKEELERGESSRILGIYAFGTGDSIFASMEHNAYEIILALTHARTALSQDIRSTQIIPDVVNDGTLDANGNLIRDRLRPHIQVPVDKPNGGGGSLFGYIAPPGPEMADAWIRVAENGFTNMAYSASQPPEVFGKNYVPNEPADAFSMITQTYRTEILDTRDDLSVILSRCWEHMTGKRLMIGWQNEPLVNTRELDDRAIKLKGAGIINTETAQKMTGSPVEEIEDANTQRTPNSPSQNIN